ncbi:tetratricopeptide repeat protein [Lentzea albidocapillata]|uniref:Tetratricopeptide repeat-containing protein n=1 Tax=Lentzea albidocapillata TaxID=40571 RepID=A0A1W2FM86_9PSEU|nr:tetratricopeptide repeat protein [Lentzea albidocapillata]SMD23097.1 Tetratricopeptide repeat-containing protein [Lentzea albidocapillata]
MPDDADLPTQSVENTVHGDVHGVVLQVGAVTGDFHHHQHPGPARATLPLRCGLVPPRAAAFQERSVDLDAPVTVLSGLPGVGKSQLAAGHAERQWAAGEVDLLVWITATSREAIVSGYADVATKLLGVEDPERGARTFLEWLAGTHEPWLVVLDDLRTPADLDGLWPPDGGQVVVTTLRRDAVLRGHQRRLVSVEAFTEAEGIAYLRTALADQPALLDDDGLVRELGGLPVALAQAAANMLDNHLSCAQYRALLPERLDPTAATWSLAVEQADRLARTGVVRPLLDVASVLEPNGIPVAVFTTRTMLDFLGVDEADARDGLGCLHRLSLVAFSEGSREVRVHSLVQRATRAAWSDERAGVVVKAAADALEEVWPDVVTDPLLGQVLRANAQALADAGGVHLWCPGGHFLLFRAGRSLGEAGYHADAVRHFDDLQATATRQLGPDHLDTLLCRFNAAGWRGSGGDAAAAVEGFRALLVDVTRLFGPDHVETLRVRNNHAYWLGISGDRAGAATAFRDLFFDQMRVLGPDHPSTLTTRHNLAFAQAKTGSHDRAVESFEALVRDLERIVGPDDPSALEARSGLAAVLAEAGEADDAADELEDLLEDQIRVLGADHPRTLWTRWSLAQWRALTGDPAGAVEEFEVLVEDQIRVLGELHPDVRATREKLEHWRGVSEPDEPGRPSPS